MNNIRFYQVVIVILVLLNLGAIAFLLFNRPRQEKTPVQGQAAEFLIKELTLTPMQQDEFGKLRYGHQEKLLILQEQDRKLHDRFFEALFLPALDTLEVKNLSDSMADLRRQMELLTFEHFMQLRQLLTEDQKMKFHRVFRQALERVMPPPAPPAPPLPPPPPPLEKR
jgi:Spy/CpxP family protein refolding chaperone